MATIGYNQGYYSRSKYNDLAFQADANISAVGEGEPTILDLVKYLQGKKKQSDIPGIYYRDNGSIKSGKLLKIIEDLDSIPSPYLTHLNDDFFDGVLIPLIQTTRGCPFKCTFCSQPFGSKKRYADPEWVVSELERIVKNRYYNPSQVIFIGSDNFTLKRKWAKKVFSGWERRKNTKPVMKSRLEM